MLLDKKQRKEILKRQAEKERTEVFNSLPFEVKYFRLLFDYLGDAIERNGCNNTLKYTLTFLNNNNLSVEQSVKWFNEHGGYCDCEVLLNCEDTLYRSRIL